MKFLKGLFGQKKGEQFLKKEDLERKATNTQSENYKIKSGIFSIDEKLIAGVYYYDEDIKALVTNLGCIKLAEKPKLIEKNKNVITLKIEGLLLKLKNKNIDNFISLKELN